MAAPVISDTGAPKPQERMFVRIVLIGLAGLATLAVALWARYGTAVFMETMGNAWAYCF